MTTGSLYIEIHNGTPDDAALCQRMTRQHPKSFPFVMLPALRECAERGTLLIVYVESQAVGFVSYRARRDGWHTIYELCVHKDWQRQGIGRALLYSVPMPVRLKCPVDLISSNAFYEKMGMRLERVDTSKKRALNVWVRLP